MNRYTRDHIGRSYRDCPSANRGFRPPRGRLLDEHPDVTACIAPQDQSVIGLLKAAADRGIRVPTDLSVVAMLDESLAELATPPLTTIGFPSDDLGRAAARILLDRLDRGRTTPDQVLVAPELTVRGSTARPPR
jgi:DNA-binding LacI/PurR family transcriptional regulator